MTSLIALILSLSYLQLLWGQEQAYSCPDQAILYDMKPCDPHERNQCPVNFVCRRSRSSSPNQAVHLCCASQNMTIGTWLEELDLSPQIVPQIPLSTLEYVRITNYSTTVQSPKIGIDEELQTLEYPNYLTANIEEIKFQSNAPAPGGYLHILSLVEIGKGPHAVFIIHDYPANGSDQLIIDLNSAKKPTFFGYLSSGALAQQDTYRSQYVVLVYKTQQPLTTFGNVTVDIISNIDRIPYFLSSSACGRALGQPIAGTFFYVTTKRSIFPVQPSYANGSHPPSPDSGRAHTSTVNLIVLAALFAHFTQLLCDFIV